MVRNIQFSVDSFADAYRASLQEMGQSRSSAEDTAGIRNAIAVLTAEN
jgi:hypothetical protein